MVHATCYMLPGSSMKREGMQQGAGRKRKKLKFDIMEDDWGATKTTPGAPMTIMEKEVDGGTTGVKGATNILLDQPEGAKAQPTDRVVRGAPLVSGE